MTINTQTGRTYAVTSTAGCTVTDANGLTLCTVDAGTQGYFVATGNTATVTGDDAAAVTMLFNAALRKLRLLAGGSKLLPAGYTKIAYLEATGTQWIKIDIADEAGESFEVETRGAFVAVSLSVEGKAVRPGVFCWGISGTDLYAGCGDSFKYSSVSADTAWHVYTLTKNADNSGVLRRDDTTVLTFAEGSPSSVLGTAGYGLWRLSDSTSYRSFRAKKSQVTFRIANATIRNYIACIDNTGEPCMFDTLTKQAAKNTGTGDFIAGIDTTAQITTLLRNLPDLTGQEAKTLQIRLADSIRTEEMEAYITAQGNSKNWLISHAA